MEGGWVSEDRGTACQPLGQGVLKRFSVLKLPEDRHVQAQGSSGEKHETDFRDPQEEPGGCLQASPSEGVGSFQVMVPGWAGMV